MNRRTPVPVHKDRERGNRNAGPGTDRARTRARRRPCIREREACLFTGGVEQAELDERGILGVQREVDPTPVPRRAQRIRRTWQELHGC